MQNAVFVDIATPMLSENGQPKPELFVPDGLHLSKEGYRIWKGLVLPHLRLGANAATPESDK